MLAAGRQQLEKWGGTDSAPEKQEKTREWSPALGACLSRADALGFPVTDTKQPAVLWSAASVMRIADWTRVCRACRTSATAKTPVTALTDVCSEGLNVTNTLVHSPGAEEREGGPST